MCYYDQTRWRCGYWKWGRFHSRCERENRIGETCGMKLVNTVFDEADYCKLCIDMEKKRRKILKMKLDIARWSEEDNRRATVQVTTEQLNMTIMKLQEMQLKHDTDVMSLSVRQ